MKQFRAVIFDMDGTLVDSADIVLGAFKHVIEESGQVYDDVIVRSYIGRLLDQTYQSIYPKHDSSELIAMHRSWQAENKHLLKGFEGLSAILEELNKRELKIGLFTSAARNRTDAILSELEIAKYFEVVICGEEVTNPKPHQEGVITVTKKLNVNLDEVIMVGDSEHDILSGKNAGVLTIGITHGFGTKQSLQDAGANYLVNNLTELQKLLQKLI